LATASPTWPAYACVAPSLLAVLACVGWVYWRAELQLFGRADHCECLLHSVMALTTLGGTATPNHTTLDGATFPSILMPSVICHHMLQPFHANYLRSTAGYPKRTHLTAHAENRLAKDRRCRLPYTHYYPTATLPRLVWRFAGPQFLAWRNDAPAMTRRATAKRFLPAAPPVQPHIQFAFRRTSANRAVADGYNLPFAIS